MVVSLNLPQIAIMSKGDMDLFWSMMDLRTELCRKALMVRHNNLKGTKSDVAPILWQHGAIARLKSGEVIDPLLMDGYSTLSLGFVGIYECVWALIGKSHTSEEGEKLAFEIMDYLRAKCDKWKAESGLGFSLYSSPEFAGLYTVKCIEN